MTALVRGGDLAFHVRRVEGHGERVDVGKDGDGAASDDGQAVEGVDGGLGDDLVPGDDAGRRRGRCGGRPVPLEWGDGRA